jgi:hypothetical protein
MFHRKYAGLKENYLNLKNSVQIPLMPNCIIIWYVIQEMNIENERTRAHTHTRARDLHIKKINSMN